MKHLLIAVSFIALNLFAYSATAQVRAVTEDGDSIYVYDDGTWTYELKEENEGNPFEELLDINVQFDTSTTPFTKPENAKQKITSKFEFFDLYYNSDDWERVPPGKINAEAELAFKHKKTDIYSTVITEEIEIGVGMTYKVAIMNAEEGSGNPVKVLKKEIRNVNGVEMLHTVFEANFAGFEATFVNNYYSGEFGTVQILTWTSTNIVDKYYQDMLDLINGFELN